MAPGACAANCFAPIMPSVSGVGAACIDTTSASASRPSSESWVASSLYGSKEITFMPEALEPPPRRPAHRAEPDQAGGPPGHLPRPVALVGDGAVPEDLALADVAVGGQQVAGDGEAAGATVISATPSALRPGVRSTGMPRAVAAGDVDVRRVAAGGADDPQRPVEHLALDEVGFADQHGGAHLVDPLGQLGAIPDPHRRRGRSTGRARHRSTCCSWSSPGPRKLAVTSATGDRTRSRQNLTSASG